MKQTLKHSGYSVLIAVFIVGFLLVLASGVFKLVLNELQSNKARSNYLQAYYGAQAGVEWALLKIKDVGYGVVDEVPLTINNKSIVLSAQPKVLTAFLPRKEALVSFDIATDVQTFSGTLAPGEHEIIPLFYIRANGIQRDVKDLMLNIGAYKDAISWNIVGENFGLAGVGDFSKITSGDYKYIESGDLKFARKSVEDFLASSANNYLLLFNAHPTQTISYTLSTTGVDRFTLPVGTVYGSGKIGNFQQNIKVSIDNTAYLNILKYSIFSN